MLVEAGTFVLARGKLDELYAWMLEAGTQEFLSGVSGGPDNRNAYRRRHNFHLVRGILGMPEPELTLGELEALAGAGLTGLFAFLHSRITHQEPFLLQDGAKIRLDGDEGTSDGEADRAGLSHETATFGFGFDVKFFQILGCNQRLEGNGTLNGGIEVIFKRASVDGDCSIAGNEFYAGDGCATSAGFDGNLLSHAEVGLKVGDGNRLLGRVRMLGISVNVKLFQHGATEAVVRNHAFDGVLDEEFRAALAAGGDGFSLVSTDPAGIGHKGFLSFLLSCKDSFRSVDDDDKVSGIYVRCENCFVFTAKNIGGFRCHFSDNFILCVDDMPATFYILSFGRVGFHNRDKSRNLVGE